MSNQPQPVNDLRHIKQMMERSSRFISLSGLSGISAGICAMAGAYLAYPAIDGYQDAGRNQSAADLSLFELMMNSRLFHIAAGTFLAALISAFVFTWIKSKREGIPIWGNTAKRLLLNVSIPLLAGGIFLVKLIDLGIFSLIAPGCLVFYGLALINASKYTLDEIRYLGYLQLFLGIINLWFPGDGIYFWAIGFGLLHIIYGLTMWMKYDREKPADPTAIEN